MATDVLKLDLWRRFWPSPSGYSCLLVSCVALVILATLFQVGYGAYRMDLATAVEGFVSPQVWSDPRVIWSLVMGEPVSKLDTETVIVWTIRLPRVLGALLVGAALGVAGAVFQAITRNELASPYILGVSAGAGLCALLVMIFSTALLPFLPVLAAMGGGLAFLVVYGVAWRGGSNPTRLVLAGVVVATILGSLQTAVYLYADDLQTVHSAISWTTGSLVGADWVSVRRALIWIIVPLIALVLAARQLDVISLGDRTAVGLGMRVEPIRFALASGAVLLAAASVTIAGTVGFVGLIIPHIVRNLVGVDHRRLLIGSALCGGTLLLVADTAARLAFSPTQVPVGIITGLVGGGYFLFLMRRRAITGVQGESEASVGASRNFRSDPVQSARSDSDGLQVEQLTLGYTETENTVNEVSLAAPRGGLTVLVGPNGSGKSTVLKGIARQIALRGGRVSFDKEDFSDLSRKKLAQRIAVLQQEHDSRLGLTVEELVMHGRYPHRNFFGAPNDRDLSAVERALECAGCGHLRERQVSELSGGQRQLAWLAMALAQGAPLLALDEPTTFLDVAHQLQLMELVKRLAAEEGLTVLLVLHDLEQAARYADHLVVLDSGRVVTAGKPADVLTRECLEAVFKINGHLESADQALKLYISGPVESVNE